MKAAVGVDVGGTKIAAGLVTGTGELLSQSVVPTNGSRPAEKILDDAVTAADVMAAEAVSKGVTIAGVGVGVPEIVDTHGRVVTSAVLDWAGLPLVDAFAHIGPTQVVADVRAAAYAEAIAGAGTGIDLFAYVSIGTGISHTLVQEGVPYSGHHGAALLLGSSTMHDQPLETIASGPAVAAVYGGLVGRSTRAEEVLGAADEGDELARAVVDTAAIALGHGLAVLVNILDPAVVIVGGGVGSAGGRYWYSMERAARQSIWLTAARDIPIRRAGLGSRSGVIGAALWVLRRDRDDASPLDVQP